MFRNLLLAIVTVVAINSGPVLAQDVTNYPGVGEWHYDGLGENGVAYSFYLALDPTDNVYSRISIAGSADGRWSIGWSILLDEKIVSFDRVNVKLDGEWGQLTSANMLDDNANNILNQEWAYIGRVDREMWVTLGMTYISTDDVLKLKRGNNVAVHYTLDDGEERMFVFSLKGSARAVNLMNGELQAGMREFMSPDVYAAEQIGLFNFVSLDCNNTWDPMIPADNASKEEIARQNELASGWMQCLTDETLQDTQMFAALVEEVGGTFRFTDEGDEYLGFESWEWWAPDECECADALRELTEEWDARYEWRRLLYGTFWQKATERNERIQGQQL